MQNLAERFNLSNLSTLLRKSGFPVCTGNLSCKVGQSINIDEKFLQNCQYIDNVLNTYFTLLQMPRTLKICRPVTT